VHGAMVFSLLSRMVGTRFPGSQSLWLRCDIGFRNPCYAPSVLRSHGVVVQQSEATRSISVTFDITDDRERQIAIARTVHKVLERWRPRTISRNTITSADLSPVCQEVLEHLETSKNNMAGCSR
jgi:hypothetical protein